VLTRRQYVAGEEIAQLLEKHRANLQRLMAGEGTGAKRRPDEPTPEQLEGRIEELLREGRDQGWYFEIDEAGNSSDQRLRCSQAASSAIEVALTAAEHLMAERRQQLLRLLAVREGELMELEDRFLLRRQQY
jgi:hypothetical protein